MHVTTVVAIKLPVDFASFNKLSTIFSKTPLTSKIPPKLIAIITSETVFIITSENTYLIGDKIEGEDALKI
jgi:hypothetical protein